MINTLVMSGGGPVGMQFIGVLQILEDAGIWHRSNIRHIFAVSVGALIAVLIGLDFDWTSISRYVVERPWEIVLTKLNLDNLLEAFTACGIVNHDYYNLFFKPFFDAKDLSMEVTMLEFYRMCGIHFHFYSVDVNTFQQVEISHETFPDLPILKALQMTSAVPMIIAPVILGDQCFLDGGLHCNYPIEECLRTGIDPQEILGIAKLDEDKPDESPSQQQKKPHAITSDTNYLSYIAKLLFLTIYNGKSYTRAEDVVGKIPREIILRGEALSLQLFGDAMMKKEMRDQYVEKGRECAHEFLGIWQAGDDVVSESLQSCLQKSL